MLADISPSLGVNQRIQGKTLVWTKQLKRRDKHEKI